VIVVLSAILIADPLATLVGIKVGGVKIPYNRDKTISGFVAYFLVVFAISFIFARQLSILIALIAAVVESLPMHMDDNFDVPLVLAILIKLAVP
jgi:dolichol kinase